ncbi:hypothetical protein ACFSCV_07315 [Methylopila henanensis]|uniref:Uncharacterized protein n=1 Tax=Methylopila henanensis TaxID=873516 RepID=A0ABW4K428_9HYPH
MTRDDFAAQLNQLLEFTSDPTEIASWAHELYLSEQHEPGVDDFLLGLIAMSMGEQFLIPIEEIRMMISSISK